MFSSYSNLYINTLDSVSTTYSYSSRPDKSEVNTVRIADINALSRFDSIGSNHPATNIEVTVLLIRHSLSANGYTSGHVRPDSFQPAKLPVSTS